AGQPAPWSVVALPNNQTEQNDWEISIPNGLGYILEFKKNLSKPVLGLKEWKPEDRPRMVGLIYYSFRIMSGIGFFLAGLMGISVIQWLRGKLSPEAIAGQKWLLRIWILAAPLGYIAVESGWIVRCVGRQPWVVYGKIRTADGVSHLPATEVLTSLLIFAGIYTALFICALFFGSRIIRQGPNLELPVPGIDTKPGVETTPAEFVPDQRPVEAQQ
ncbi:cytochrome ubiquinol oxidase subunit I, partial [Trichormus variabilis]